MIGKILNGLIYDGTGREPFVGSLEIREGRISRITEGPEPTGRDSVGISEGTLAGTSAGTEVLDAAGMAVTPGFVDIHRHHDLAILYDPSFGEVEIAQGITTVVGGNCGLGAFPNHPAFMKQQLDYIQPVMGKISEGCDIHSFGGYLDALEDMKLPVSHGMLVGAGAVTMAVKGFEPREFTSEERSKAVALVEEAMERGALGLSFGIMYVPECYLSREDRVALAAACGGRGGMVCTHIRGEGDSLVPSVREVIEICREARVPLNISHFKVTGVRNWGKGISAAIALIEQTREEGQQVTCDAYPYTGGATTALSLIPPSVIEGHPVSYLGTPEGVRRLREEIYRPQKNWDNMVESIGWERVVIGSVTLEKNRVYSGKDVASIARELGQEDPCAWFGELVAEEEGKVGIIIMSMSPEDVDRVLQLPYSCLISDSLYGGGDNPHPRLYGAFPRFIREYVMERQVLTLQEAIRKMTWAPAMRMGIEGKGKLAAGMDADINIFDPASIKDKATFTCSKQLSEGIAYTLIGGEIAAVNSRLQPGRYGRVLRRK